MRNFTHDSFSNKSNMVRSWFEANIKIYFNDGFSSNLAYAGELLLTRFSFRLLATHFILLVQNKVGKQNDTPLPLVSFGLSAASGRLRNSDFQSSNSPRRLSICRSSWRRGKGDWKSKPDECSGKMMLWKAHGYCLAWHVLSPRRVD